MQFNHLATRTLKLSLPVVVAVLMVFCTITYAENSSQPPPKKLEAWEQAQDYSLVHPVIAFAVYGRTPNFTARENAERIREFFAGQNIQSQYFLALEHDMKSAVEFFIQGVSYGPVGLGNALPIIQKWRPITRKNISVILSFLNLRMEPYPFFKPGAIEFEATSSNSRVLSSGWALAVNVS